MGSEWKDCTLSDIANIETGFPFKSKEYTDSGTLKVIRGKNITEGFVRWGIDSKFWDFDTEQLQKYLNRIEDIVIGMDGSKIGKNRAQLLPSDMPSILAQRVCRVRAFSGVSEQNFLWQIINSVQFEKYIKLIQTGTSIPHISLKQVGDFTLKLPPLPEQKAIAHILGSLDDKIELNRQMNQTLEQMAQALFKSWFVDFDPVIDNALAAGNPMPEALKAKAKQRQALGNQRKPLPKDIQSLFPDRFEFNEELDKWVPGGWRVKNINDLVKSVSDTYPLKTVEKVIFLNTGDILEGKFLHNEYSDSKGLPGQAKKTIQKGDILYSEIRPKNKRYAYVHFDSKEYVVSTKLMVLRSITDVNTLFVYYFLKQEGNIEFMQLLAESRSGTFPQITFDILSSLRLVVPTKNNLIDYFTNHYLRPMQKKMLHTENEIEQLTKLRDTLLPKLISGEVRVNEQPIS